VLKASRTIAQLSDESRRRLVRKPCDWGQRVQKARRAHEAHPETRLIAFAVSIISAASVWKCGSLNRAATY